MKTFIVSLVIGTLVLACLSPASAQSSDRGTWVGVAETHDSKAEKSSYIQKAQDDIRIWQQKLDDFDTRMKGNTTDAQTSASKDLDDAWTQTKMASSRLESAGEKDWDGAKASFESASQKLLVAWQKVNPADK